VLVPKPRVLTDGRRGVGVRKGVRFLSMVARREGGGFSLIGKGREERARGSKTEKAVVCADEGGEMSERMF